MESTKSLFIESFFEGLEGDFKRARRLYYSKAFRLEGMTVMICQIAALARYRYPNERDWKSFKDIISNYSGKYDVYENIDLLFFYQWPESKLASDREYQKLAHYIAIKAEFEKSFGDIESIRSGSNRYQKREYLEALLQSSNIDGFESSNFLRFIELYSNNQIFYQYARCHAVHNNDFPLINIGVSYPKRVKTYTDNHQITGTVVVETLEGILKNAKQECLDNDKWLHELCV